MSLLNKVKADYRLGNTYELNNEEVNNRHNCQSNPAEEQKLNFDNQSLLNSFISVKIILQFLSIAKYNISDDKMSRLKSTHDAKIKHHK